MERQHHRHAALFGGAHNGRAEEQQRIVDVDGVDVLLFYDIPHVAGGPAVPDGAKGQQRLSRAVGGLLIAALIDDDGVAVLLQQGALSREAAARVNAFCNCASPGFCIGLVGLGVFGSARTGAVLYGIHALSALLTGLVVARGPMAQSAGGRAAAAPREGFAFAFCGATQQAARTALTVTAFLTVFSVLLRLLRPALRALPYGDMLAGLIELTNGLDELTLLPLTICAQLTLASFLLGFGGLAVQFQARALTAPFALPSGAFTLGKLLHGTIAAVCTALLFQLSPRALAVFAGAAAPPRAFNLTGAVLLGVLVLLLIWGGKSTKNKI